MDTVPVLTKQQLKDANNWAIEVGYNKALKPEPLEKYLDSIDEDTRFPIIFSMSHNHAAGKPVEEHIRCEIILDNEGSKSLLDLDLDLFNTLERIEVPSK